MNLYNIVASYKSVQRSNKKAEEKDAFWKGSIFKSIVNFSPKSKGAFGEKLVSEICESQYNLLVAKRTSPEHDRIIGGVRTEIKLSFCWDETPGKWVFQQIRPEGDYERVIFIGINPDEVRIWWVTKADAKTCSIPQHGGKEGIDTRWVSITKEQIPSQFKNMENW